MTKRATQTPAHIKETAPQKVGARKRKNGRPTLYHEGMLVEAFEMAKGGAIDTEIAQALGISLATYYLWRNQNPKFLDVLRAGKAQWDERIEASLARKAAGFTYTERQVVKLKDTFGEDSSERVEIVEVEREALPDTAAAIFWLKNRDPNRWKDRHQMDVDQTVTVEHSPEDMRALAMATLALLTQATTTHLPPTIEGSHHDQAVPVTQESSDNPGKPDPGHGAGQADNDFFI